MKQKTNISEKHRQELFTIIREWKLPQPLLAKTIAMNANTFKLKLNEKQSQYSFTDEELKSLLRSIFLLSSSISRLYKKAIPQTKDKLTWTKK